MANLLFINSIKNKNLLGEIEKGLLASGHKIVSSTSHIKPGEPWSKYLYDVLDKTDIAIVLVTKEYIASLELKAATEGVKGYLMQQQKPYIIPLLINNVEIPDSLSEYQCIAGTTSNLNDLILRLSSALNDLQGKIKAKEYDESKIQEQMKKTAADYVKSSLKVLKDKERRYQRNAYWWYGITCFSLILCVIFGIWRIFFSYQNDILISSQIQFIVFSLIILSLLIALSRFAFLLGKSFMVEALRNADRIHAISFGEFYLNAYGERAEWKEVKEAFQHWNIDIGSTFINQNASDYDPELIKNGIEIARIISGKKKKQ